MVATHFDAVIVGSGFGGSVMAYRLAEAGLKVCLLERGKAYPPNSFPRSPHLMKRNFWNPSDGLHGMFNIWTFEGLAAVMSSGLGGGSLIYANVLIRKDEKWFIKEDLASGGYEYWPVTRADLDPHYDRVEKMMAVQKYPLDHAPYSGTSKTLALKHAAEQLGLDWHLPNLAVTFGNPGETPVPGEPIHELHRNLHDRTRYTCRLCGECDVGCNYGSKNTLDFNYLSEAKRLSANIRTRSEVRSFAPRDGGGYTITYLYHDPANEGHPTDTNDPSVVPPQTITADRLILSAGTIGSTYLLLKNRAAFPHLSEQLGSRFCGNGDFLSFVLRCSEEANGARGPRVIDPAFGPVITSTIRVPDALDGGEGRGFYLQDAGYPGFASWMLQMMDSPGVIERAFHTMTRVVRSRLGFGDLMTDLGSEIANAFGACDLSAGSMPLLGMGRDIPDGKISMKGKVLDVDWVNKSSGEYFKRVRDTSAAVAEQLGGTFVENPTYHLNRLITVHALGGAPMGRTAAEGVVNSYGEVFNYPGLYVADGAVMPGPVGPNPSLTIAALSDRFADHLLEGYTRSNA